MSGAEFRRKAKRNKLLVIELVRRGYVQGDPLADISLYDEMVRKHLTYRSLSRQHQSSVKSVHQRVKRVK